MTFNKRRGVQDGATRTCVKLLNANCCFDFRFALFRKTLDAEMKNATKSGNAVVSKKEDRKEITAERRLYSGRKDFYEPQQLSRYFVRFIFITGKFLVCGLVSIDCLENVI